MEHAETVIGGIILVVVSAAFLYFLHRLRKNPAAARRLIQIDGQPWRINADDVDVTLEAARTPVSHSNQSVSAPPPPRGDLGQFAEPPGQSIHDLHPPQS